eukprot:8361837-Pyramimonas_sp.AAC.1
MSALLVPGRAVEPDATTQRGALLKLHWQVRRDTTLNAKAEAVGDLAEAFHGGGLVSLVWLAVAILEWFWPANGTIH